MQPRRSGPAGGAAADSRPPNEDDFVRVDDDSIRARFCGTVSTASIRGASYGHRPGIPERIPAASGTPSYDQLRKAANWAGQPA